MFLEKPAFSPALTLEDAEKKVSSLLKKMRWKDYTFPSRIHSPSATHAHGTIFYVPFWFFSYALFEHTGQKTKLVSRGHGCLNAFSSEFDDEMSKLVKIEAAEKSNEIDDNSAAKVLDSRISEDEARGIITLTLASESGTSKENVIVSGLQLFFVPIWLIEAQVEGAKFSLRVNAVNGHVINSSAVPRRGKNFAELTHEMLEELSAPSGWLDYSAGAASLISGKIFSLPKKFFGEAGHSPSGKHGATQARPKTEQHAGANGDAGHAAASADAGPLFHFFSNPDLQILALAGAAIIVILAVAYL